MNDRAERSLSGRIDEICDAFEKVWKSNQRPSIVKHLKGFDGPQRLKLLRELLLLDIDYRHRRGEDINQADYETEIPEVTEIFTEVIEEIVNRDTRLENSKSDTRDSSVTIEISPDLVTERSVSRFKILKHHAAGGLGDVFIARDSELNREVALKEIKPKFAHHEHSRNRFVVEAEITGRLEHPGVVPVYGMGKYDDGRPYYAMRFIKGDTLQDAIRSYHKEKKQTHEATLELRKLLNQFIDVCNAVEYAHSRGVIHRDLKPPNVMLGKFGETLVVDWGLAKQVGKKSKTKIPIPEATLRVTRTSDSTAETQHGDIVGTAQYMSPEQAAGQLDVLSPASDVYSLGAVLFCILTGQPPFEEAKSVGLEELLKAVRKGRFQKPREIESKAPKALEAICLKAMQTEPEDRFESTKLLADDVERYLADEPVEVHREPLLSRTARWGRKHKAIVSSTVVLLVTSVIALSVSNLVIADAYRETQLAHDDTKREKERAEQNEKETRKTIDNYVETVKNAELLKVERFKPLLKELLKDALAHYERFIAQHEHDDESLHELASALDLVGFINIESGDVEEAIKAYRQSIEIREILVADNPTVTEYQDALAGNHFNIGNLYKSTGQPDKGLVSSKKALEIRETLVEENPTVTVYQKNLASSHNNIGALYQSTGKLDEALVSYNNALEIQETLVEEKPSVTKYQSALAGYHNNIGYLYANTGKPDEALVSYKKALGIQETLVEENPTMTVYQNFLANHHINIGNLYQSTGKSDEALKSYKKALEVNETLVEENPTVTEYQGKLANSHNNIGALYQSIGKPEEALVSNKKALEIKETLVEENPTVTKYQSELADSHYNFGLLYQFTGKPNESLESYNKALEIKEKLVEENPTVTENQNDLANIHNNIGLLYESTEKPDEALVSYKKALELRETLVEENPTVTEYQDALAGNHFNIGNMYKSTGQPDEGLVSSKKALEIKEKLVEENPTVIKHQIDLANIHNIIGTLYQSNGKPDEALFSYKKAFEIQEKLVEENPSSIEMAIGLGRSYYNTALLASSQKDYKSAATYYDLGVKALLKVVDNNPRHPTARLILSSAHWGRANLMQTLERFDEAVADWEKAIEYDNGSKKNQFRLSRANALVKSKKYRLAYVEAKNLAEETKQQPTMQYNMACVISLASDVVNDDKTISAAEKEEMISRYRKEAVDLLKLAMKLGFFDTPEKLKLIQTDHDLDPLRKHDEFKKLLSEIKSSAKAKLQKQKKKLNTQTKMKKKKSERSLIAPRPNNHSASSHDLCDERFAMVSDAGCLF